MRRDSLQSVSFGARLVDDPELEHFDIPQAAVDEPGRFTARPAREVLPFEERGLEPAQGRITGTARPGNAAANHHDVKGLQLQLFDARSAGGARLRCEVRWLRR
jgi:hypothetical protein